jgi:hypothetical protein
MTEEWKKLRRFVEAERRGYATAVKGARSKDASTVFAALEGAYGGIIRKMDALQGDTR